MVSIIMVLSINTLAYAMESVECTTLPIFEVYSSEFPDAYIIIDNPIETMNGNKILAENENNIEKSLGTETATAFVK